MQTVTELVVGEEREALAQNALLLDWRIGSISLLTFSVGLTARDGSVFSVLCDCEGYKLSPPAWHWYDPATGGRDPALAPRHFGFFHKNGVICAPWNRLAYKSVDSRGPHEDWSLATWLTNEKTGECKTLSAMVLRIHRELSSGEFRGRSG